MNKDDILHILNPFPITLQIYIYDYENGDFNNATIYLRGDRGNGFNPEHIMKTFYLINKEEMRDKYRLHSNKMLSNNIKEIKKLLDLKKIFKDKIIEEIDSFNFKPTKTLKLKLYSIDDIYNFFSLFIDLIQTDESTLKFYRNRKLKYLYNVK